MMNELVLSNAKIDDDKPLTDIGIAGGKINEMGKNLNGDTIIDINGDVVVPSFIETHIHLDKALLESVKPNTEGTLAGAIKITGDLKKGFQDEEVYQRAKKVLEMCMYHGSTIIRCFPDTDPLARLVGFKACMRLKEEYKDFVQMQVGAFAQEGLIKSPGAYGFLEEALKMGADLVNGCPYNENSYEDTMKHIDQIFELGKKYKVDVGFHADFGDNVDDKRYRSIDYIIEKTEKEKYQGRVTVSHMTSLSSVEPAVLEDTIKRMARAKINLVSCVATDIFLSGRGDKNKVRRGVLNPIPFKKGGVNHSFSTNNVMNGFTPFGNGDLLLIGNLYAHTCQLGTPTDQKMLLDMITNNSAKTLRIEDTYGLEPKKNADLVVISAKNIRDIFVNVPMRRIVMHHGQIIFRAEKAAVKLKPHSGGSGKQ